MVYDKAALDAERAAITMTMDADVKSFESGFGAVQTMRYEPLSVKFVPVSEASLKEDPFKFEGHEIKGFGSALQEAIDDWKANLKKVPSSGLLLLWRVFPEVEWSFNFDTNKVQWMVYARIAIQTEIMEG